VFVALVIQQAKRVRRIVLSSMACMAVSNFPDYLKSGTVFVQMLLKLKFVF
jgi:hypothetical protein